MDISQILKSDVSTCSGNIIVAELQYARQRVAGILLQHAGTDTPRRSGLSQREMAERLNTSWDTVNSSLKSLQAEGAIRIDRHRMIINKKVLERIAV